MKRNSAALLLLTLKPGGGGVANTAVPTTDGTAPVIGTEIAGTAGTWTGSPTLTYQWQRYSGSWADIGGATAIDYTPVDADFGLTLRLVEIPNGVTASAAYSAATGEVGLAALLYDAFTTDDAAPITTPRTAEPGPGTGTVTDTGNYLSISGSRLLFGNTTSAWVDPRIVYDSFARAAGRVLFFKITTSTACVSGWYTGTAGGSSNSRLALYLSNATTLHLYNGSQIELGLTLTTSQEYQIALVLQAAGGFGLIKGGSQFADWTLLAIDRITSTTPLYPCFAQNGEGPQYYDDLGVADLGGNWASAYGIATQRSASASAGDTLSHTADAIVEATWTAVTSETLDFDVRRTDNDNRWIIRCSQGGSTVKLIEEVAGVETERGSAAQTWTNATAYRITVRMSGSRIQVWVGFAAAAATTSKIVYASASFNATAVLSKVDKTVTEYISWPVTITGEDAERLDGANFS